MSSNRARVHQVIEMPDPSSQGYSSEEEYIFMLTQASGKLEGYEVKLHIDDSIQPVPQPARRIPFHMRQQVPAELEKLEQQGIIEKVDGPISPLVVIPKKNGEIRLCVDMRMPNKAIRRERHPTPTIDDLIHSFNGATVFSKLDLRSGYHQLLRADI